MKRVKIRHDADASSGNAVMNPAQKALWFIESHLAEALTLDEIAGVAGVSRFHMVRAFAAATGLPVMRYVRARRLTEAARALVGGAPDILELAVDADYGSHEAFTRAFRDHFGITPEAVRAGADRFGRYPEMIAERAGECFVRAVIRIHRQFENVRCAADKRTRRLGETPGAHITHDRQPRRGGEGPHHVKTRDPGNASDLVEGQRLGEMAFDKPERFLGRIHHRISGPVFSKSRLTFEACP